MKLTLYHILFLAGLALAPFVYVGYNVYKAFGGL